jgi:hypothetical protein
MKNCKLNTCSELYSSECVLYTGELITDSYITLSGCNPTLNEYLNQVDILLKGIKDNENLLVADVKAANCGFSKIDTLLATMSNLDGATKVKTAPTIIALLKIICDQQAEIDGLKNGDIFTIPLNDAIRQKLLCFSGLLDDPCGDIVEVKTLQDLLIQIIAKLCRCCPN